MTGKGQIASAPNRRLKKLVAIHALWIGLVLGLFGWWGHLIYTQAAQIAELETRLGTEPQTVVEQRLKTRRMIFWESSALLVLLLASGGGLLWLYARDARRTRELEAFFASITHELKTPLTSIRLQAESMADTPVAEPRHRDLIRRLLEDTTRLETHVERTLELARLEGGGPVFAREVPIADWIENALAPWKEIPAERLKLHTRLADGLTVHADPVALDVILRNLLENSMRHSGRAPVSVEIAGENGGDRVVLTFKDDGAGFSGDSKNLGVLFRKGPQSRGAGVGLYLVASLMTRMNGQAEFRNAGGFETRLTFRSSSGASRG